MLRTVAVAALALVAAPARADPLCGLNLDCSSTHVAVDSATATGTNPVDTGVTLDSRSVVKLTAEGKTTFCPQPVCVDMHPDGDGIVPANANAVLPGAPVASLLYKVGDGAWKYAGASTSISGADAQGKLFLAYNDDQSSYGDNTGVYQVDLQKCYGSCQVTYTEVIANTHSGVAPLKTGIAINALTTIKVNAAGTTGFCAFDPCKSTYPDGTTPEAKYGNGDPVFTGPVPCSDADCALPGANVGALLYRVGDSGAWKVAGHEVVVTAAKDGQGELQFAYNDGTSAPSMADNSGSIIVALQNCWSTPCDVAAAGAAEAKNLFANGLSNLRREFHFPTNYPTGLPSGLYPTKLDSVFSLPTFPTKMPLLSAGYVPKFDAGLGAISGVAKHFETAVKSMTGH